MSSSIQVIALHRATSCQIRARREAYAPLWSVADQCVPVTIGLRDGQSVPVHCFEFLHSSSTKRSLPKKTEGFVAKRRPFLSIRKGHVVDIPGSLRPPGYPPPTRESPTSAKPGGDAGKEEAGTEIHDSAKLAIPSAVSSAWEDGATSEPLMTCYQQADDLTLLEVMSHSKKISSDVRAG